jgi:hypothetical protein
LQAEILGDAFVDLENWQGVRTFDTTVGQWNTPDAYAGDVHDPMSQKPYMWNRNNPYQYSDPTGYAATVTEDANNVTVNISVKFIGDNIDDSLKQAIMSAIEKAWSGPDKDGYNVTVHVSEQKGEPDALTNTITLTNRDPNSPAGRAGTLWSRNVTASRFADPYVFAHEAGHLMGLNDQYDTVHEPHAPLPGFEHNIMGAYGQLGITGDQIRGIIQVNGPNPPFFGAGVP